MMNYDSVEEIFATHLENMTAYRNGSKNDDGTDEIPMPDWVKFNGSNNLKKLYSSGNTWFGFGASQSHLLINQRDAACWYLHYEEGTLFGYYKFFKVRWGGYPFYSSTSSSEFEVYNIIFWDTGAISIYAESVPASNTAGSYSFIGQAFNPFTTANRDVTFIPTNEECTSYETIYERLILQVPFMTKYLIKSEDKIYTIKENALELLEATELDAALFKEHGFDDPPSSEILLTLVDPEIFLWGDTEELDVGKITAKMDATPFVQTIVSEAIDLSNETIKGIYSATATDTGTIKYAVSFMSNSNWKKRDGTLWNDVLDSQDGMTSEVLNAITKEQWQSIYEENLCPTIHFYLRAVLLSKDATITKVVFSFKN